MDSGTLVLIGWAFMTVMISVLWLVQRAKGKRRRGRRRLDCRRFGILAVFYAGFAGGDPAQRLLVAVLVGVWSTRLALHVYLDRIRGKEEDGRYQMLRERWGDRAQLWFFLFFQVQAFWSVLFSIPFLAVTSNASPLGPWDILGTVIWLVAVGGESVADRQLARWRSRPENHGKTCREGLWRLSRHPNYFFEWIHWWAYVIAAIGAPGWWMTLISPAIISFFLLRVTGIPATERQALRSRGDAYREYQRTTSASVPWFRRSARPTAGSGRPRGPKG